MSNARPWSSLRSFANLSRLTRLHFTVLLTLVASLASGAAASDAHAQGISFAPTWVESTLSTPGARTSASMAYDAATGQVVLFGGVSISSGNIGPPTIVTLNDTWTWNCLLYTSRCV